MKPFFRAFWPILVVAAIVALAPTFSGPMLDASSRELILRMGIVAIMAVSLALVNGVTGQFSLGHAAFQAVGAYVAACLFALVWSDPNGAFPASWTSGHSLVFLRVCAWGTILVGALLAAGVGWLVALPCLRLRGDYLAIVTLGFNEIVGVLIRAQGPIGRVNPGGPRGFNDIPRGLVGNFADIYITLFLTILILGRLVRSRRGLAFEAVREDEVAAEAVGVDTTRAKVLAFVLSSFFAGLAGGLYAFKNASISDRAFDTVHSIDYVVMVILGGNGSLIGSAVAAMGLTALIERLRDFEQWRMVAYSFLLIWVMISRIGSLSSWSWRRLRPKPSPVTLDPAAESDPPRLSTPPSPVTLSLESATIRFGGLKAVDGLDLTIGPGECVGLIGPNGAGKSTVFNMIMGVYRPTSGSIRLGDVSVAGMRPHRLVSRGVSRTFQNIRLFPAMTVLDNVRTAALCRHGGSLISAIGRTASHRKIEAEMEADCLDLLRQFHLERFARERADRLPYGAQRRLEIARALAARPSVLLLDEPAAGMNPSEKEELNAILRSVHADRGVSLLLIEHDMGVVMGICPRIIVLDHGRKIAEGSPDEVRANPLVVEAYLGPDETGEGS